jgi:hypothetical protein
MRSILFLILITLTTSSVAQTFTEQLIDCSNIEMDEDRLSCYDSAINDGLKPRVENSFGQEDELVAEIVEEAPDSLMVTVAEIAQGPAPDFKIIVTLENGQIWRQTDIDRVYWEQGEQVEITRGLFGSFFMKSVEGGRRIRVTRAN